MAVHVESVVEKIAMKQVYFEFFAFSLPFIIPPFQILSPLIWGEYTSGIKIKFHKNSSDVPKVIKVN
jgi:hypothetical protein